VTLSRLKAGIRCRSITVIGVDRRKKRYCYVPCSWHSWGSLVVSRCIVPSAAVWVSNSHATNLKRLAYGQIDGFTFSVRYLFNFVFLRVASCCVYYYNLWGGGALSIAAVIFRMSFYYYFIPTTCFDPLGPSSGGIYTSSFLGAILLQRSRCSF
jgi:hypothetical protein